MPVIEEFPPLPLAPSVAGSQAPEEAGPRDPAESELEPSVPGELERILSEQISLEVSTLELVFLSVLRLRGKAGSLNTFNEAQLIAAFELACSYADPRAENIRHRATHALRRLREQRFLARVDGAGVLRPGEFSLTRLASAVVDFYLEDETLTRESLGQLLRSLEILLAELLAEARRDRTGGHWNERVHQPLSVTVKDLLSGIERRQRGLDLQQEVFQSQVKALLEADWFGAIERCQQMLDDTADTLRELNEMLLTHGHRLGSLLEDLQDVAIEAGERDSELAARQLGDQLEQVAAWGASRQSAWSEYYDYVHRYLRDVVRLDPARAITQRLREQLSSHAARPFALTVATMEPIRLLREVKPSTEPPPVIRPKKPREVKPEQTAAEPDPMVELEARVQLELERGVSSLAELTRRLTEGMSEEERFLTAGRIAQVIANLKRPPRLFERTWVHVNKQLSIEERQLESGNGALAQEEKNV